MNLLDLPSDMLALIARSCTKLETLFNLGAACKKTERLVGQHILSDPARIDYMECPTWYKDVEYFTTVVLDSSTDLDDLMNIRYLPNAEVLKIKSVVAENQFITVHSFYYKLPKLKKIITNRISTNIPEYSRNYVVFVYSKNCCIRVQAKDNIIGPSDMYVNVRIANTNFPVKTIPDMLKKVFTKQKILEIAANVGMLIYFSGAMVYQLRKAENHSSPIQQLTTFTTILIGSTNIIHIISSLRYSLLNIYHSIQGYFNEESDIQ